MIPLASGPLDTAAYDHQRTILKCLHWARPVWYEGKEQFLQTVSARLAGGKVQMDVYLTGRPGAIDSALIGLKGE